MSWPGEDPPPAWQQPQQQPSWGYQQWQPPPRTSGLAIASLITSIVGSLICFVGGIIGLILGIVALNQISNSQGRITGRGLAIAGIVVGALGLAIAVLAFVAFGIGTFWESSN